LFPGVTFGLQSAIYPNFGDKTYSPYVDDDFYLYHLLKINPIIHFGHKGKALIVDHLFKSREVPNLCDIPNSVVSGVASCLMRNDKFPEARISEYITKFDERMDLKSPFADLAFLFKQIAKISAYRKHRHINRENAKGFLMNKDKKRFKVCKITKPTDIHFFRLPLGKFASNGNFSFSVYTHADMYFIDFPGKFMFVFTRTDISHIINYCDALAGAYFFGKYKEIIDSDPNYNNRLFEFINLYSSCPADKIDKFCESWTSASRVVRCKLAGALSYNAMKIQIAERDEKKHNEVVSLQTFFSICNNKSPQTFADVSSLNRVCMPPDYDVTAAFSEEMEMHHSKNKVGIEVSQEHEDLYKQFLDYNRYQFISHFFKAYHHLPGYVADDCPNTGFRDAYNRNPRHWPIMNEKDTNYVVLRGCLKYKKRDEDIEMYFKDAGFIPDNLHSNLSDERIFKKDSNMIVHMIQGDSRFDLDKYRTEFTKREHPIKASFKVESGKELGRLFFVYGLGDKMLMAELEENISDFLKHVPGNAVGVANIAIREKMLKWNKLEAYEDVNIKPLFMSDDISKWSPHMPVRVQEDSARFWAEIYDQDWIGDITEIDKKDQVFCNIMNYKATYSSFGANKEGTSGKRITYLMINLKAFCTGILRGKRGGEELIHGKAHLLTFLDDGLTVVDVRKDKFFEDATKVIEGYSRIQAAIGYTLKTSKCYPSDSYMIFLNYEYAGGKRLYDHFKSFAKLFTRKSGDLMSFPERLREVATWAIGACDTSSEMMATYMAYVYRSVVEEYNWLGYKDREAPTQAKTLQWISPIALGGYGLLPIHCIASGISRSSFTECLKTVQMLARVKPVFKPAYIAIVKTPIAVKAPTAALRSPDTIVYAVPHLTEHRVTHIIEDKLIKDSCSPYLGEYVSILRNDKLKDFAAEVMDKLKLPVCAAYQAAYESSPMYFVDKMIAKVRKASTLQDLLSNDDIVKVMKANEADVRKASSVFVDRMSMAGL